jgi:hypothetical protein
MTPGVVQQTCLGADQHLPGSICGPSDDDYVVTNVPWNDVDHGLNVHDQPALNSAKVDTLPSNSVGIRVGTCLTGSDDRIWCQVECPNRNSKGWARDTYLTLRSASIYTVIGVSSKDIGLKIHNGPDIACTVVDTILPDSKNIVLHLTIGLGGA